MKRAVMYDGGNIGRGFIGALLSASGLAKDSTIAVMIIENYGLLMDGATPRDLRRVANHLKAAPAKKMI